MWNPFRRSLVRTHAKEITGDAWMNITSLSDVARRAAVNRSPLRFDTELSGVITLIHFWDYSSPESVEDLPFLSRWWEMYEGKDFVIIGVHTPQYAFAKDADKVEAAAIRFHLDYPIVSDSEFTTWKRYGVHDWPRKILVDEKGVVQFDHKGKGGHEDLELKIHELLERKQGRSGFIHPGNTVTPQIMLDRESLGMRGIALSPLTDPAEYHIPNKIPLHGIALSGWWVTGNTGIVSGPLSDTQSCVVHFYGSGAMGIMMAFGGPSATIQVYVDNKKIGDDIVVSDEREYSFITNIPAASHHLTIIPLKGTIAIRSVSFL